MKTCSVKNSQNSPKGAHPCDTAHIEYNDITPDATPFGVTPLFSMTAVSLASSQHYRSVDADAQRKRALMTHRVYHERSKRSS